MFTESEISVIIENKKIEEITDQLRKDFIQKEAPYFEISNHDFLSLILLSPSVGLSMANNNISFKEEMALQKKARKLSKGGFFLSKDPVADGMKFLIKKFKDWQDPFYAAINAIFDTLFDEQSLAAANSSDLGYQASVMHSPYLLVRFISCLVLERDEDILSPGKIRAIEFDKTKEIGEKTGIAKLKLFQNFLLAYEVK